MTVYAFVRLPVVGSDPEILFTSEDPAEVAKRWREPDAEHLALRALDAGGLVVHPSVEEARAVYEAKGEADA